MWKRQVAAYQEPLPLVTSVYGTGKHHTRGKGNTSKAINPSVYTSDLPTWYTEAIVAQNLGEKPTIYLIEFDASIYELEFMPGTVLVSKN